ncbi:MAG: tRNA dihydrouridine synthase DusB [Deltaproteobacteria bacterium]|nr:tRNA dihydrouridine synthase DusB [Deltaproteobacteria bacterium]
MLRIGTVTLENHLVLAPMAGITNLPFRTLARRLGAGLVTTEMVSAMGLTMGHPRTRSYLRSWSDEKPLAVQLFGAGPRSMAEAARIAVEAGADIIDINMGCPVRKVAKTGAGAALLDHPERVAEIVTAVRLACTVPLTAKIRAGWAPERPTGLEIARVIADCEADAVTVHPRFATQRYTGRADWRLIGAGKGAARIPVMGNGDVFRAEDALRMRAETGCDGVMIGRSAVGNPWIFRQVLDLEAGREPGEPTLSERRAHILEHYRLLARAVGEQRAPYMMRGLLLAYTKGLPYSSRFRGRITSIKDFDTLTELMDDYFETLEGEGEP